MSQTLFVRGAMQRKPDQAKSAVACRFLTPCIGPQESKTHLTRCSTSQDQLWCVNSVSLYALLHLYPHLTKEKSTANSRKRSSTGPYAPARQGAGPPPVLRSMEGPSLLGSRHTSATNLHDPAGADTDPYWIDGRFYEYPSSGAPHQPVTVPSQNLP